MAGSRPVRIRHLPYIQRWNHRLYEALLDIQASLLPQIQDPPPAVSGINVVSGGNGFVDVTLTDSGTVNQGVNYFVEHDTNPNFTNPRVEDLGASRSGTIPVGSGSRYFRAYSQYRFPPSQPTPPVVFGGMHTATAVAGGGVSTPALQSSTGSGTASTTGQQGSSGFGKVRIRTTKIPAVA